MSRLGLLAIVALLSSCGSQNPSTTKMYDPLHRVQFFIEQIPGPVLKQAKHRVYVQNGDKRDLIFEGYGGETFAIKPLRVGVVVIEYCGGGIRKISPFTGKRSSGDFVNVEVQPIIIPNIEIDGKQLCAAK